MCDIAKAKMSQMGLKNYLRKKNYELDFIKIKIFYCSKDFLKNMHSKLDYKQMIYMYYIYI